MSIYDTVAQLNGVGEKRVLALKELGIDTIYDLLVHFPFRYEDIRQRDISSVMDQEKVTVKGTVVSPPSVQYYGRQKNRLSFKISSDHMVFAVHFFNQPYLKNKILLGEEIALYGKWDEKRQALMGMKVLGTAQQKDVEAVYRSSKQIKQSTIIQLIQQAVERYSEDIPEVIPSQLRKKHQLISHKEAIRTIHFPKEQDQMSEARRQLIYQELFVHQIQLQSLKQERRQQQGQEVLYSNDRLKQFIATLPFELTQAQKQAVNDICYDLRSPYQMNRLLQGDVGSGKTIVAIVTMVAAAIAGKQSALMVPTELLADQHFRVFQSLVRETGITVELLTGTISSRKKEREKLLDGLKSGAIDIVIGTHALFQEHVAFHSLAYVVIDEQHRFGVEQRRRLIDKGSRVNVLHMTATPIPRTLAITTYGDMDTSIIKQLPNGRLPIQTKWVKEQELIKVFQFVKKKIEQGEQAYIVSALIEESETLDVQSAIELYRQISAQFEGVATVGLLHGKMKPDEKDAVMSAFQRNEVHILVATTVVEVGVDVPNATVMVILDADRFGLAQLHQLRGRVGRGEKASYCMLVASPKTEMGNERMMIMCQSTDGFYLSQKDLELRGAGDVLGTKQSGLPVFSIADVVRDYDILEQCRMDAMECMREDAFKVSESYRLLKEMIEKSKYKGVSRND